VAGPHRRALAGPARRVRVATRYDKHQANDLAMVTIAAIVLLWLE
jgi:hypothetical protein